MAPGRILLIRHGETDWSRDWRHTGRTDVPLNQVGEGQAAELGPQVTGHEYAAVFASPLQRATQTAALAGLRITSTDDDLMEWDYGELEGVTSADWRRDDPTWWLWRDGAPGGESLDAVAARAGRALERIRPHLEAGDVAVVAHGHLLRVLAAVWSELPPLAAAHLRLDAAGLSVLGHEHDTPVLLRWNCPPGSDPLA